MDQRALTLKGTPEGLVLHPLIGSWEEVLSALERSLNEAGSFFQGGRVILELQGQSLGEEDLQLLRALLEQHELELWAVLGGDEAVQHLARMYGIRTRLPASTPQPSTKPLGNALLSAKTLRSGQSLYFPEHITLVGDINPGAEVTAGGNIVVWGRVQGVVHAGAMGDTTAVICALDLNPSQLRIATLIARAPEEKKRRPIKPEMAMIRDGVIVAEPWTPRG
ncbi:MAG: septum site-determining protein MinC [Anaerolineae bacterium]|jgi:septum site-determining protein MinC|nr:septum site-determining protein MinC [Anaerolineae bacterium]